MDLLNKPVFIETIGRLSRSTNPQYTLIYIEINHALQVASLLGGISAEEQLLTAIQTSILSKVQQLTESYLGNLGCNRFGIIVKMPVQGGVEFAEELAGWLDRQCIVIDGQSYYPKLIMGVTALSLEYKTPERVLAAVDEALYQARRTGNSLVKLIRHDDPALQKYSACLELLPVLREGLLNQSFVLYAQPIVPVTQAVVGQKAEVLLRYKNKDGKIYSQHQFLQSADLFNINREVDLYVLHQFCRFIEQQERQDVVYSLNISGGTIRYVPFFDFVKKTFERFGVNPEQVCFEITETIADRDYQQAIGFMHRLKDQLGCQLALDDIGVGSSNLINLPKFNVDFMKIDGSFITALLDDPYAELVVGFITSAARLYGKKTIAEYVENAGQLEKLKDLGVDYAQGYITGKPELLFDPSLNP
ncbi:MAG: GGDEF domain-containing phosphodiesterase [Nitrosomonas sp.]|nr:GGDEF domain-containing phosphodiesterase [Nitrosomonas sp.]